MATYDDVVDVFESLDNLAEDLEFPKNWAPLETWVPYGVRHLIQRALKEYSKTNPLPTPGVHCSQWWNEVSAMQKIKNTSDKEMLSLIAEVFCDGLGVPLDCSRALSEHEEHQLFYYTNCRTIQVFCAHSESERHELDQIPAVAREYSLLKEGGHLEKGSTYESYTRVTLWNTRKLAIWEFIIPDGIDMEAFSPRDVNINLKPKQPSLKAKAVPAKVPSQKSVQREKDHPPPPPPEVREPPSSDRRNGAVYHTGNLLGKGGFAICYEGQLESSKEKIALKIVKSRMPQKKMEQKFQTELQIHSKMRHANIVQFHRAFSFQSNTYIVLELCPNGSLMDMVRKRKFVTEPEVRFYTIQMAGAIKYMHRKGIIHRDLKMGNIFLDKDMNVKIGDFGLAAMLVSGKDMTTIRRTTLCGTPNYIAPEIVEKNKKGHDHAVDIWSLGIIIFAMLTGRPPFQSSTQDEIYRRAKERDYDWPKMSTSENCIGQEAKDLVAELLQDPECRPNPDAIVQHPFFVSGWVPQAEEMSPSLKESPPDPSQFLAIGLRGGRQNLYNKNFRKLCIKSDVGPYSSTQKTHSSTYKEVAAEERAGLTPAVPLPEDVVYRPFHEVLRENAQLVAEESEDVENVIPATTELPPIYRQQLLSKKPAQLPTRQAPQSFAAQQRAQYQPPAPSASIRAKRARTNTAENQPSVARDYVQSDTGSIRSYSTRREATARSQTPVEEVRVPEKTLAVQARLGADMVHQLGKAEAQRKSKEETKPPPTATRFSLFHPQERQEEFPETKPDQILENLRVLQRELERALNSRSAAPIAEPRTSSPDLVVKWVDYTNKFGLGYILSNGSVGCIFGKSVTTYAHGTGYIPPTYVVVRNSEQHVQNRSNDNYPDRDQLVPIHGDRIEFFESKGERGLSRVTVNPQRFIVKVDEDGKAGTLSRGTDEFDDRKRQKIVLWRKFANYMTAFGKDQEYPYDAALDRFSSNGRRQPRVDLVTFYQRFGDVGCWAFFDGHFQFNFPDHTKIVLSADGKWCDFYHLPLEAARDLATEGTLSASALDDRQHLSYPLQTLLNFIVKAATIRGRSGGVSTRSTKYQIDPLIQGIPEANDFRRKITFIRNVVAEWVTNGGLGNSAMDPEHRLRWCGYRELKVVKKPYKHVWTTVGARRGDERHVAWFDPEKPTDIVPDIEG